MKINNSTSASGAAGKPGEGAQKVPPKKAFTEVLDGRKTPDEASRDAKVLGSLEDLEGKEIVDQVEEREVMREEEEALRFGERQVEKREGWRDDLQRNEVKKEEPLLARGQKEEGPAMGGPSKSREARAVEGRGEELQVKGVDIGAKETLKAEKTEEPRPTQQVAREIVEALHVGHDSHARKVVLVDVHIPGKGNVRIRLRRQGDNVEVRMRTQNEDLARELRSGREDLREAGREKGVKFTSIEVVS
ncbi:MAG: flagellar hook-length control protein FliK [Bradymonadaceae bacterium]